MADTLFPDPRVAKLEKALSIQAREILQLRKSIDELSRRLAQVGGVVAAHSSSISRLGRSQP